MNRIFAVIAALLLLTQAGFAVAEGVAPPSALQRFQEGGGEITFMGHAYGLDGWLIVNAERNQRKIAYTTPDGGVVTGILWAPDGSNETDRQLTALKQIRDGGQTALPGAGQETASSPKTEKLYAAVEAASWVKAGADDAPYLYMFMNTTCPHCQEFWKDLRGPMQRGQVQVRLVPYGQMEINRASGAGLLAAADPAAAWDAFIAGDKAALAPEKSDPAALARVDANTKLFRDWKLQGPPFALYRRPADGRIMAVAGRPENTLALLADIMKKGG